MLIHCYIIGRGLPCSKHQSNPYQPIHEADLHSLSYRLESLLKNFFSKNSLKSGTVFYYFNLGHPQLMSVCYNNHSP
jgi:hypothetical protein